MGKQEKLSLSGFTYLFLCAHGEKRVRDEYDSKVDWCATTSCFGAEIKKTKKLV